MSSLQRPTRGGPARGQEVGQAVDHEANELVVREGGARPIYEAAIALNKVYKGGGDPLGTLPLTIDTASLPAAPGEQLLANSVDFAEHDRLAIVLRPPSAGATTHTSFDISVYAWSEGPGWVLVDSISGAAMSREYVVLTRYRRAFVRITAASGGADGNVLLWIAGVGSPSTPSTYRVG